MSVFTAIIGTTKFNQFREHPLRHIHYGTVMAEKKSLSPNTVSKNTLNNTTTIPRRRFIATATALTMGAAFNISTPRISRAQELDLDTALAPRVTGNPDAPYSIAEYFSLTCGHCADFHLTTYKEIKANLIDTRLIRFEYRDFPLDRVAIVAHALARAVPVAAYPSIIDTLLSRQQQWRDAPNPISELAQIARMAGIGQEAFASLLANRPLLEGIVEIAQQGSGDWGINSTPSFIINDSEVLAGNVGYEKFLDALGMPV